MRVRSGVPYHILFLSLRKRIISTLKVILTKMKFHQKTHI
jgi:hypothetical protein